MIHDGLLGTLPEQFSIRPHYIEEYNRLFEKERQNRSIARCTIIKEELMIRCRGHIIYIGLKIVI